MISHFRRITSTGKFIKYFTLESDIVLLRKQLNYRSNNLGMKELDLLVGRWAEIHLPGMTYEQLQEYNERVLTVETPDLYKNLLDHQAPLPTDEYLKRIKLWGLGK